jgi:catecholate siderophore receptor
MLRNTAHTHTHPLQLHACAIGVALAAALPTTAQAAGNTGREPVALGATSITGETADQTYQSENASSPKYTAPLRDTPRSVTVIPQQVIRDTGALTLQDALRTVPGITFGAGEGGNPQGIDHSFEGLMPREISTWTAYGTPGAKAGKYSPLNL